VQKATTSATAQMTSSRAKVEFPTLETTLYGLREYAAPDRFVEDQTRHGKGGQSFGRERRENLRKVGVGKLEAEAPSGIDGEHGRL
jgi:hypothetical protein